MDELIELLDTALSAAVHNEEIYSFQRIPDEPATFGVELNGGEFFISVERA